MLVKQNVISLCRLIVCLGDGEPCGAFPKIHELECTGSHLGKYFEVNLDPFAYFAESLPCRPAFQPVQMVGKRTSVKRLTKD